MNLNSRRLCIAPSYRNTSHSEQYQYETYPVLEL